MDVAQGFHMSHFPFPPWPSHSRHHENNDNGLVQALLMLMLMNQNNNAAPIQVPLGGGFPGK